MKNQNQPNVRLSKNQNLLVVQLEDRTAFINVNLVKHLLEISYTKKDGTTVSVEAIREMKLKAREAYASAVAKNVKAEAAIA
mgnify:CR=1 FL=1